MSALDWDILDAEKLSPLNGSPVVQFDAENLPSTLPPAGVLIAVDEAGALPEFDLAKFDTLVTTRSDAPRPWVSVLSARLSAYLARIRSQAERMPVASSVLAKVMRIGEQLPLEEALELESLAYSTLLGGSEFARWRGSATHSLAAEPEHSLVRYERTDNTVTLTLNAPVSRNAMTARMRDALFEALANVLEDPSEPNLVLRGEGRCFSTGGDIGEFGTAKDLAAAHVIRTQRSCSRLLHRLGARAEVRLHGACIGSGIEVAAAGWRRVGNANTFLQLPELGMGLIPGAGGTATLGRAIGRHRLMWMALGGFRVPAPQALAWGALHAIEA